MTETRTGYLYSGETERWTVYGDSEIVRRIEEMGRAHGVTFNRMNVILLRQALGMPVNGYRPLRDDGEDNRGL